MKRNIVLINIISIFLFSLTAFGNGFDNLQLFSAEYSRTFSRNAATDAADAAVYNPAGVMKMDNGIYGNFGIYYVDRTHTNTIAGEDSDSKLPSIIPGLFLVSKNDKWAGFITMTAVAGGGAVEFEDGSATVVKLADSYGYEQDLVNPHEIEGDSNYIEYRLGGAYSFTENLSIALGLRFIDAIGYGTITIKSQVFPNAVLDYDDSASAWGGFLAFNYALNDQWNFGFRYETNVALEFDRDVKRNDLSPFVDLVDEYNRDLAALLGIGAEYKINPELKVSLSVTYYLNKSADWDDDADMDGDEDDIDDSYDIGVGLTYAVSDSWEISTGIGRMVPHGSMDADDLIPEDPSLSATAVVIGTRYTFKNHLRLNVGLCYPMYESVDFTAGNTEVEYKKETPFVAFGIEYKFK